MKRKTEADRRKIWKHRAGLLWDLLWIPVIVISWATSCALVFVLFGEGVCVAYAAFSCIISVLFGAWWDLHGRDKLDEILEKWNP